MLYNRHMPPSDSPPSTNAVSQGPPLLELTWFPAMVLSFLLTLGMTVVLSALQPNLRNEFIDIMFWAGSIPYVRLLCVAYGCLIGYGGQRVRRPIALLYIPWMLFSVAFVYDILQGMYPLGNLFLLLLYVGPLGLMSERSRENPLVGAIYVGALALLIPIFFLAIVTPYFIFLVHFFLFPVFVAVVPTLIGFACGWFLRQLTETRTSRHTPRTVRRIVPRQFSIMSLFAMTTAVAIGTWTATQVKLPPASWLGLIVCSLVGNLVAILVVRFCSDPILPTHSLDDLRHTHDPLATLIYCPNCRQTSRRETCFCPHCNVAYGEMMNAER